MALLKKFHDVNKEAYKNAPMMGTGMGGNFMLDAILDKAIQAYVD